MLENSFVRMINEDVVEHGWKSEKLRVIFYCVWKTALKTRRLLT